MTRHDYNIYMDDQKFVIKLNRKLAKLGYPLMVVPNKIKAPKQCRKIGWLECYKMIKSNNRQTVLIG